MLPPPLSGSRKCSGMRTYLTQQSGGCAFLVDPGRKKHTTISTSGGAKRRRENFWGVFYTRPSAKLPAHACLAASPLTLQPLGQASSPAPPPLLGAAQRRKGREGWRVRLTLRVLGCSAG